MRLTIIEPPSAGTPPTKAAIEAAVRNAFAVVRRQGIAIVHRNRLDSLIRNWLVVNGFFAAAGDDDEAGTGSDYVDELLGTGKFSSHSFERAAFVLKGGAWYCVLPDRAVLLGDSEAGRAFAVLSPLTPEAILEQLPPGNKPTLQKAGVAYVCVCAPGVSPWPVVGILESVGLKEHPYQEDVAMNARRFLLDEIVAASKGERTASVTSISDLSLLSRNELNDRIKVISMDRREQLDEVVFNRPRRLWGDLELGDGMVAFPAISTKRTADGTHSAERRIVLLCQGLAPGDRSSARIVKEVNLDPFLSSRVEWAMWAAIGTPIAASFSPAEDGWETLTLSSKHRLRVAGPLRTWLSMVGEPADTMNGDPRWRTKAEARTAISRLLRQYFVKPIS